MTMTVRTTESTVTFSHPFRTTALELIQPAGTYRVVTDEEEIIGLSFLAFRRTATTLHMPALGVSTTTRQVVSIEPSELDAILEADSRPA